MTVAVSMTKAQKLERSERLEDAAKIYGDILTRFPKNSKARKALDTLSERLNNTDEPPKDICSAIAALFDRGDFNRASSLCAEYLNSFRKSHFLWNTLGHCHLKRGTLNEAATCLNKACELDPKVAQTYALMAAVCTQQGNAANAVALYRKSLQLDPNSLHALNELGNVLLRNQRQTEAVEYLRQAAEVAPDNARVLFNYASALRETGQHLAAQSMYEKALEKDEYLSAAHFNLGQLHILNGQHEDALPHLEKALSITNDDRALASKLYAKAHLNDWSWQAEYATVHRYIGLCGTACPPFQMMTLEDNPDLLRLRTQAYADQQFGAAPAPAPECLHMNRPERLRVGYFSADFHDHATMHLMGGLFAAHDKSRFEIFAYSYGPDAHDTGRRQVTDCVDQFFEVGSMVDTDLIELAKSHRLDIAIDLKGYTGNNRTALFANRLAPIQIAYLGYPGTMATSAFDYLITDSVVCPPGSERFYSERLIRLPHCYQVNDDKRPLPGRELTRSDCGLPTHGFVFCCFNNSYKITPAEFDIWMRLLTKVPDSVLWLLDSSETSKANLRKEAENRGVAPDRLIFAPRASHEEHMARHRVADLFLDTFAVNAHTTASDALWSGLPLVTMAGKQFAARVAASLLTAIGLPQLITTSPEAYEACALELARDSDKHARLRASLLVAKSTTPLFDTRSFTRHLELGFDESYNRLLQGLAPDHITLLPEAKQPIRDTAENDIPLAV